MLNRRGLAALSLPLLLGLNGCSYVIGSATQDFGDRLKQTLLEHNDPDTVADAMPAYLLLMEASLAGDADNENLLLGTANLYGAYLSLLADESPRKVVLSQKALAFALRGACVHQQHFCELQNKTVAELQAIIENSGIEDIDSLYGVAVAWASWIQARKQDWNAIAQLAQVKLIMQRVLVLDDGYRQGNPHLYLAVLESLVPANLGGNPDLAKQHFERALQLAPDNLMAPVLYAKHYGRMMFDRDLHDKLLKTALAAQPAAPGLTLINTLAQKQAQQLLDSANDYFLTPSPSYETNLT